MSTNSDLPAANAEQALSHLTLLRSVRALATPAARPEINTALAQVDADADAADKAGFDVVVIGAGFAGVSAARALAAMGLHTVLLEARDRIGGRVWTETFDGEQVELGGTWIDQKQPFVWAETRRLNLQVVSDAPPQRAIFPTPNGFTTFAAAEAFAHHATLVDPFFEGSEEYFPQPFNPYARLDLITPLDQLSMQDRLDQLNYSEADKLFIDQFAGGFTGSASTIGFTEMAHWWALAGHNYDGLAGVNTLRPAIGSVGMLNAILSGSQVPLRLNSPVNSVVNDGRGVTVTTRSGKVYRARATVVATPVNLWNSINFAPRLPSEFTAMSTQGIGVRGAQKFLIHVRGSDLGRFYAEAPAGSPVMVVFPFQERADGTNIVIGFSADAAFDPTNQQALQQVLRQFVPDIEVLAVRAQHWGRDPFSLGGWAVRAPGVLTGPMRTLQRPLGRIAFATSDIALGWNGYMDGAIESGLRAATHIAALLRGRSSDEAQEQFVASAPVG
ncbi:flavin monoamine oxidase family protein [Actinokineospora iranica]|uniref:Monoamine oxidase n=1 Tax=Actinokineospora iranica TaxID=1271860 RepID=A0A1G6RYJ2_9PSEU|nr:NAD(P)/FAD-dependent oxidoreductase [Actinokineospora iranica]SDD09491.1 Monoamine oxidase [Actinokineospora iranica]